MISYINTKNRTSYKVPDVTSPLLFRPPLSLL
jgi:hypothetical protein